MPRLLTFLAVEFDAELVAGRVLTVGDVLAQDSSSRAVNDLGILVRAAEIACGCGIVPRRGRSEAA